MSKWALAPAVFVTCLVALSPLSACESKATGSSSNPQQTNDRAPHSKGVARVLVDFSNSFSPFDDTKARQIELVFNSIAKHIVRNWSLRGTFSVHGIDASTVTAPPLCPPIEYNSGGLLHQATVDLPKVASACARLVKTKSQTPSKISDITNAINIAASSFSADPQTTRLIVIISDFVDTDRSEVQMDSLRGIDVMMVYAPEKTATNSNVFLGRMSSWERRLGERGANSVRKIQLLTISESDVLTQLPDRSQ